MGATQRRSEHWRTNVARGAVSEYRHLEPDHAKLAVAAADAVGADIAGVDLIEDRRGSLTVLEVNDRVEFRGFQQAQGTRVDVAGSIAELLITRAKS